MKIAYLILAHKDPLHLNRLISALDTENVTFYIHIDLKSSGLINEIHLKKNIIIVSKYKIYWGGWNMLQASLTLLKMAYINNHDRYVFISGQDYPLVSNNKIVKFLAKETNHFFYFTDESIIQKRLFRYHFFYPMDLVRGSVRLAWRFGQIHSFLSKIGLLNIKKMEDSKKVYFGTQWGILTHTTTKKLLKILESSPKILRFFKYTFIPDEMFFQTMLLSYLPTDTTNNYLMTFQQWDSNLIHPLILTEKDTKEIFISEKIFVRKCDSLNSSILLDSIDEYRK